ncbi:hypothetical protein [Tunturiibacter gelidiferens]|uniref:hypothetical protein n=1 Tax=Tunturiibacter gelidiferens TaxID=3069689 RepID=UPI003D9B4F90
MRIKQAAAIAIIGLAPALTGCLTHTRIVPKTRPADVVLNAELEDLLKQVDVRFGAVQTMNASIEIVATTGGGRQGKETRYPSFSGYIFLRKPQNLRVLLRVPFLGSVALDMVSDGKIWKFWVPRRNLAMTGTSEVTKPSTNGLENLRPAVFFDSLLIKGLGPDQVVSLTQDTRVVANEKTRKISSRNRITTSNFWRSLKARPPTPFASSTSAAPICCPISRTSTAPTVPS